MWYMLLESKLRLHSNLLGPTIAAGHARAARTPAPPRARDSLITRLRDMANGARLRRRAIGELVRLNDRMLRDIGLERARIPEVVDAMRGREFAAPRRAVSSGAAPGSARDSVLGRIAGGLARAWVRRQAISGLARLDDRLLRDIGLERDGIPDAVDAMLRREPAPAPAQSATVHRLVVKGAETDRRDSAPTLAAA